MASSAHIPPENAKEQTYKDHTKYPKNQSELSYPCMAQ